MVVARDHEARGDAAGPGPALEARGLVRRFGDHVAVDRVDLRLDPGEVLGFVGLNGAGKSTTIRMLCGLLEPHAGSVHIGGVDLATRPAEAVDRLGYVPDRCSVHPWMRVGEAIAFCRRLRPRWDDALATSMLEVFKLDPRRKVKALSKGMAAKLSLLLAIAHRPDVLILDEPMSGLDPIVHEEFLDGVLRAVIDNGQTVLFSSHGLDDVQRLADTVAILHEGRLVEHRSLHDLLDGARRIRAVLPADPSGARPEPPCPPPPGTIRHAMDRREWTLTVRDCDEELVRRLRDEHGFEHVDVQEVGLGELFKDYVRGAGGAEVTS